MSLMRSTLLLVALSLLSLPARAGLLLEPYLGYEFGDAKVKTTMGTGEWTTSGLAFGARVGMTFPIVFVALDYSMANDLKFKGKDGTTDEDGSRSTLAAVVGAKLPLVRAYAGYAFLNDHTLKSNSGDVTLKGSGVKLGVGFTGFPIVSVNLEYLMSKFDKVKSNGNEVSIGSGQIYEEATANAFMLSVSAPFSF